MSKYDDHGHIPDDTYLVIRDGRTSSPRTLEQLMSLAEAGKLKPDDELVQRVMGGSIPIGSAGEQSWFPGNAAAMHHDVAAEQGLGDASSIGHGPLSSASHLLKRQWIRVSLVVTIGLVLLASIMLWTMRLDRTSRSSVQAGFSAPHDAEVRTRYASLKEETDRFLQSPRDPHGLVQRIDDFMADVAWQRHLVSREASDLALVARDLRAIVWNSRSRVESDLAKAISLITRAKTCYVSNNLEIGDRALEDAKSLLDSLPQMAPVGLSDTEYRLPSDLIAEASSERSRAEERIASRVRKKEEATRLAEAKRAEQEQLLQAAEVAAREEEAKLAAYAATLHWIEEHPSDYFHCLFAALRSGFKASFSHGPVTQELFIRAYDVRRSRHRSVMESLDFVLMATFVNTHIERNKEEIRGVANVEVYMRRQGLDWSVEEVVLIDFRTDLLNRELMELSAAHMCKKHLAVTNDRFSAAVREAAGCAMRLALKDR